MRAKVTRYQLKGAVSVLISHLLFCFVYSQDNHRLVVHWADKDSASISRNIGLKTTFRSFTECSIYVEKLPAYLQRKGFIAASVDNFTSAGNQSAIWLFTGQQYKSLNLAIRNSDKPYLQQAGFQWVESKEKLLNFPAYNEAVEKLLDYYENNGYPFIKINLDSVAIANGQINALLNIDKGFLYRIDSIRLYGPARISRNFIHHYLNIEKGAPYTKEKLEKINQRLLELPYLEQAQPWNLSMLNTGSLVNLYLKPKKSNQVDVLAGFLPSNDQLGGKLLLTVDARLQLKNAFGGGESLGALWQQIQPKSPKLNLQFTQPYLFNSPFGVDFMFELYKKDSAFLNVNGQLGLLYMLSPTKTARVLLQTQRTNVLLTDTLSVKFFKRLPDISDVSSINLGVDYEVSNTDYKFNPRKGNELTVSLLAGNKTIRKNSAITQIKDPDFDYSQLYDSLKLKTYQLRLRLTATQYFKTGKQTVLKASINTGWYESPSYFRNELFQIGGYRLLRGFDEESIYANRYAVGTLEYRYLLGLNANFFVFSDFGYANNRILRQSNSFIGAGAGLSFETKGGIFNLSLAEGKRNDGNFNIKQSKIHLGYVSIF